MDGRPGSDGVVVECVASEGGIEATIEHAREQVALAKRALEELPGGSTRTSLVNLADYVLTRDGGRADIAGG